MGPNYHSCTKIIYYTKCGKCNYKKPPVLPPASPKDHCAVCWRLALKHLPLQLRSRGWGRRAGHSPCAVPTEAEDLRTRRTLSLNSCSLRNHEMGLSHSRVQNRESSGKERWHLTHGARAHAKRTCASPLGKAPPRTLAGVAHGQSVG